MSFGSNIIRHAPVYILGGALVTTFLAGTVGSYHKTSSTEVGVRTRKLFGPGVEDKVYQAGAGYFFFPLINDWTTYDTSFQTLEMKGEGDSERSALSFKTREGNDLRVDIRIMYRLIRDKVVYIRQNVAASNEELRDKVVVPIARSHTRDFLGELSTQEFYTAETRNAACDKTKEGLRKLLEPYGVELLEVGLMDYSFTKKYQAVLNEKINAEQDMLRIEKQILAEKEQNAKILNDARAQVNEQLTRVDAEYTNAVAQADAYFDQQVALAKAILREGENTAAIITRERESLSSQGGETKVKMAILEAIAGKRIIMVPYGGGNALQLQSFNLNDFLQLKGLENVTTPPRTK
jgi:regulator of protease activity HflC (stomatin/prohibitin superfamily)